MRYAGLKLIVLMLILNTGCAYYNTFFNAKKYFNEAEKEREKRLENKKRRGGQASNQRNLDKPSSNEIKKLDESIKKASKVLEIYPKSKYIDDALFLLGKCFYRKEEYPKAKRKFLELIQNFPNSEFVAEGKLWLGKTNIELQDYETTERNFHAILNSKAKKEIRDEAQFLLGGLFKHKEDYLTAIEEFKTAASRAKDRSIRANAYYEMGDCYYQLKNYSEAVESFKRARKYSPDSKFEFNTMMRAGLALKDMQQYDEAIKIFTNLLGDIVNEENFPICRLEISHCNRLKGEIDIAIDWYLDVITEHPKTEEAATAYYYLGKLYQGGGNYEQAKEYFDKSPLENSKAEIVSDAKLKSKSIQQLLTLRENIEAQRRKIARGDSVAAILENLDVNEDELPPYDLSELDTLVAATLLIPLDSLAAYQDTLLPLYKSYYAKHYDRFGEKILAVNTPSFTGKPKIELTQLDSIVAQALKFRLNYPEEFADSLYHIYDRYYANYQKNKLIYEQFYQKENVLGKNDQLGTPLEELVKSKMLLAEIYLFEFNQPDSALKEFVDILEKDTTQKAIPRALFTIGYICETFKKDTLLADSVYQRLVMDYPEDPFAQQARKKIKKIEVIDPDAVIAQKFKLAEKTYLDDKKYEDAITRFEKIYKESPTSDYAPKALLAMGWIYEKNIQEYDKAFEIYQNLVDDYPATSYAKQVKPKVDEVLKARSSNKEQGAAEPDSTLAAGQAKTLTDTTQVADISMLEKEQYRHYLRQEMDKNDPRRKTPKRW